MDRRGFIKLVGAAGVSAPMGSALAFDDHVLNCMPNKEPVKPEAATFQAETIGEDLIIDLEECHRVSYLQSMDEWYPLIPTDRQLAEPIPSTLHRELQVSIESLDTLLMDFLQNAQAFSKPIRIRHTGYEIDEPGRIVEADITFVRPCWRMDLTIKLLGKDNG